MGSIRKLFERHEDAFDEPGGPFIASSFSEPSEHEIFFISLVEQELIFSKLPRNLWEEFLPLSELSGELRFGIDESAMKSKILKELSGDEFDIEDIVLLMKIASVLKAKIQTQSVNLAFCLGQEYRSLMSKFDTEFAENMTKIRSKMGSRGKRTKSFAVEFFIDLCRVFIDKKIDLKFDPLKRAMLFREVPDASMKFPVEQLFASRGISSIRIDRSGGKENYIIETEDDDKIKEISATTCRKEITALKKIYR